MRRYLAVIVSSFVFLLLATTANASEGRFELRNQVGEEARCEAYSVLMQDRNFNVLMSCRDIIYPGGTNVFNYVVWASPIGGGNPIRLGTVGLGKASFKTKSGFNNLFITKENDSKPRSPVGTVVMSGNIQISQLLDNPNNNLVLENELGSSETTPTPSPSAAPSRNIGRVVALGGVFAFVAIFGVVLVIFVMSRRR